MAPVRFPPSNERLTNASLPERDVAEKSVLIKSMLQLIGDGSSSQESPIQLPYVCTTLTSLLPPHHFLK